MQAPLVVAPAPAGRRNDEGGLCGVFKDGKVWRRVYPSRRLTHALKWKCEALRHTNAL
jgi:hypothetical protein